MFQNLCDTYLLSLYLFIYIETLDMMWDKYSRVD